jgi:hypothetical protein
MTDVQFAAAITDEGDWYVALLASRSDQPG